MGKTWDQVLTGMVIVSAAVVDDRTFVFGANWDETYAGPNPPRKTRLLACHLDDGWSGKQNSNGYDFARTAAGQSRALFTDAAGAVTLFDFESGERGMEANMPVGGTSTLAQIGDHFYACGLARSFLRRDAPDNWTVLSEVKGSFKEERAAGNYNAMAGTADDNIFLGLNRKDAPGEVHHWNGSELSVIELPADVTSDIAPRTMFIHDICADTEGRIFVSGNRGELLMGGAEGFVALVGQKAKSLPGMTLCWFKDTLFGAIDAGLFQFDFDESVWVPAPFVEDENAPVNFPHLDANENVMLVAGGFGASIYDGESWTRIAGDVTPLDITRLYLMEQQVKDISELRDILKDLPKAD